MDDCRLPPVDNPGVLEVAPGIGGTGLALAFTAAIALSCSISSIASLRSIFLSVLTISASALLFASALPGAGVGCFGDAFGGLALPVDGEYSTVGGVFAGAEPDALTGVLGGGVPCIALGGTGP